MNKPHFQIEPVLEEKNKGIFAVYPLERGYGNTMGNVLRRVLLSSLPGAAVNFVKIKGISHPFSTVKGLKEDVLTFLLNVKLVKFAYTAEEEQKLVLKKKGKGKIYAKDIEDSTLCKVVNGDLYLGELADDGSLEVELYVDRGIGYVPAEEKEPREYGLLPLDSIYTPILNVMVQVEGTRVGRKTNYDKLLLTIETDGSISPKDALSKAATQLVHYFTMLSMGGVEMPKQDNMSTLSAAASLNKEDKDTMMVDELDLPTRVINALIKHGVETVKQLVAMQDDDFAQIRGLGKKSVDELKDKLKELKLV